VESIAKFIEFRASDLGIPVFSLPGVERALRKELVAAKARAMKIPYFQDRHKVFIMFESGEPKYILQLTLEESRTISEDRIYGVYGVDKVISTCWVRSLSDNIHILPVFKCGMCHG
jgi:hypothetical protein